MIITKRVLPLVLVAIPVLSLNSSFKLHAVIEDTKVHNGMKGVGHNQFMGKAAVTTNSLPPLITPEPTLKITKLAQHNRIREALPPPPPPPGGNNGFSASLSSQISSSLSTQLSSSLSTQLSSSLSAQSSSSLSAAISSASQSAQSAIDAAKSSASQSAQSAIESAQASASSVVSSVLSATTGTSLTTSTSLTASTTTTESSTATRSTTSTLASTLSTVRSTSQVAEYTSPIGYTLSPESGGLNLSGGQLAGIIVGVFLVSSFSSILATYFLLRYRRKRAVINSTPGPSDKARRQWPWPSFRRIRGDAGSTNHPANLSLGHYQFRNGFRSMLRPEIRCPTREKSPVSEVPLPSPLGPGSPNDQILPVSPMSERQLGGSSRERPLSVRFPFLGNSTRRRSSSEISDETPIKFMISRNRTQSGTQQMHLVRVGRKEIAARQLPNLRTTAMLPSQNRAPDRAISSLPSPPSIPLRFSSLNAYNAPGPQGPASSVGDDATFLLTTDDESADPIPEPAHSLARSGSSQFSIINQDLTQFDPGGGLGQQQQQQPISRFSVSTVPPPSLDHSGSSSSPVADQQQHPELMTALRPVPPSPSQLRAPVPRRLHLVPNIGLATSFYGGESSDPETHSSENGR
ncbi:hypothetical protein F5B22DRAFT_442283 [Xylaria bambusicola]|uniref:uncharacterized protein n=1 Tax=Xylaria bambusicola TaxID=326684 RepID=UPI0020075485|nr:uncharacterized protein F5B22DRAFT_442283 [Xylaria bambusicola]KAI0506588.1 hypothetical protein F5B22DRAFT_442283 [Xylaria bambusicola]